MFHRATWLLMPPTAFLSLTALILYFAWRLHCLLQAQTLISRRQGATVADGTTSLTLAWFFLAIELLSILPNTLPYVLRSLAVRQRNRKKDRLAGDDVPTVDILITCCNEDLDVILDTARAACELDYPRDKYRIFVCDDGSSLQVQDAMHSLASIYGNLFYTARGKSLVRDYKAGNLNHGLLYSSRTPWTVYSYGGPLYPPAAMWRSDVLKSCNISIDSMSLQSSRPSSPSVQKEISAGRSRTSQFVAGLDADMIPEPHWLRTMLPHLIDDSTVAMACPPQTFYDVPVNDPLTQTMSQFSGITEVVNDSLGHADCLGSGYVMRRTALNSIGGFPTQSLSEDMCCSATLLGAGWKTAFVQEPLQYGSVPVSLFAHIKQRTRWFVGHVQTAALFNFRLFGRRGRRLNLAQRLAGIAFDMRQLVQVPLTLTYVAIPFALLSGYPLIIWTSTFELVWLIRLVSIWMLCHWIHQGVMGIIAGLGNGFYDMRMASYDAQLEQWMGPYILAAFFRSFILPRRLGGVKAGFTSTGSIHSDLHERSVHFRASFWKRLRVMLIHQWVFIHVLFVLACLGGVGLAFARCFDFDHVPSAYNVHEPRTKEERFIYLVVRVGWPPMLWLQNAASAMSPILYMLSPPTTPEREDLLNRDPKTGVAYPKKEARRPKKSIWIAWRYVVVTVSFLYTVALVVMTMRMEHDKGGWLNF